MKRLDRIIESLILCFVIQNIINIIVHNID